MLELRHPDAPFGRYQQQRFSALGQVPDELGVPAARFTRLSGLLQQLERKLANRLQHAVTRAGLVQRLYEHDARGDQGADRLERVKVIRATLAERLHRLEREPADKYPEPPEQPSLGRS